MQTLKFHQVKNIKIKFVRILRNMFFIDYNGDVLMCSHDWSKEKILGNLNENNFFEIWNSDKSKFVRKNLNSSKTALLHVNKKCDVVGDLVGKNHADAWKKYYSK